MLNGEDDSLKQLVEIRTDEQLKITVKYIKGLAEDYETEVSPKIIEETERLLGEENFDRLRAIDFIMNAKVLIDAEWETEYGDINNAIVGSPIHDFSHDFDVAIDPLAFEGCIEDLDNLPTDMFDWKLHEKTRNILIDKKLRNLLLTKPFIEIKVNYDEIKKYMEDDETFEQLTSAQLMKIGKMMKNVIDRNYPMQIQKLIRYSIARILIDLEIYKGDE